MTSILGIGGTNGAGKDSIGELLADKYGWLFVSVSQLLRDELTKQGLPTDRHHTHQLSARWRRQSGLGVLIDKAVEFYKPNENKYSGLAISSLRNPGEADEVHKLGGKVIWVDADPKIRYQRVQGRAHGRVEDNKSFGQFLAEEQHQMHPSGDEATLNMSGVKAKADIFLENNTDKESFFKEIEKALNLKP